MAKCFSYFKPAETADFVVLLISIRHKKYSVIVKIKLCNVFLNLKNKKQNKKSKLKITNIINV